MRSAAVTTGAGHANRVDRVQLVALVERAKPDQAGLVTVTIGDITRGDILIDITVPVSGAVNLAANVCGVSVDVITADCAGRLRNLREYAHQPLGAAHAVGVAWSLAPPARLRHAAVAPTTGASPWLREAPENRLGRFPSPEVPADVDRYFVGLDRGCHGAFDASRIGGPAERFEHQRG